MGWNSEVDPTADQTSHTLLPEGHVRFVVAKIKRVRKEFGKYGTINVAEINVMVAPIADDLEPVQVTLNIGLHADLQWKITEFFTSIGQRAHGDKGKFVPRWNEVEGASGFAINGHRELTNKKGTKYKVNDLIKFVTEEELAGEPNF
jgi:hypothetical protein